VHGPRSLQLALASFWTVDGLLQLQPRNFTSSLVTDTILGNAENQPQPIYGSLVSAVHLLAPYHLELNVAIVAVEVTIALGLLWRLTVKPALALSIPWALGVWWFGEGFGGIFAGTATQLVGAPGPALLYALLALVAWPRKRPSSGAIAASGALGERGALVAWSSLWIGGAILRIAPFWFSPVYALQGDFQLSLDEEPRWFMHVNDTLSHVAGAAGLPLVILVAVVEAAVGIGVLTRHRRRALTAGIVLSTLYWIFGQQLAGLFTGRSTDISAGPLYVLLAYALWPRSAGPDVPYSKDSRIPVEALPRSKSEPADSELRNGFQEYPMRAHPEFARREK
jgi:hypothetical protein